MRISNWSSDVCSSGLLTLVNLMRAKVYGVFGTLSLGMRILADEGVALDQMTDGKSVAYGKSVSVRVDLGGPRRIKKKILTMMHDARITNKGLYIRLTWEVLSSREVPWSENIK